jgi:hypothetical protein
VHCGHKRAATVLKYWQLRRSEFYAANSITIIAAICALPALALHEPGFWYEEDARACPTGCEDNLSALALHRFVREPLELDRKWMSKPISHCAVIKPAVFFLGEMHH